MNENDGEQLQICLDRLQGRLRDSGLHVVGTMVTEIADPAGLTGTSTLLVSIDAIIGDLAYSKRVQNPDEASIDDELRQMEAGMGSGFDEKRQAMMERIARGESPFADEGDEA